MKRNRKTAAVLAGFIMMALVMVSCNESNSYRELTKQEIQSAFLTVRGYHTPFAEFITDNELKEALLQQPFQEVKCKIHFVGLSPVLFYVGVDAPAYNITYGGQSHKVQLAFYGNANSCVVWRYTSSVAVSTRMEPIRKNIFLLPTFRCCCLRLISSSTFVAV